MPGNALAIVATILEKAALGATDSEIAELVETARGALPSPSIGPDIERLRLQVNAVAQVIRESRVNERALNLLNETTHDLSNTLASQDLLRTIVTRARNLVGANLAWLSQFDEEQSVLQTVECEGHISSATWEMKANVGYGAVSLIVSSKSFFDTQDYLGDQRFQHLDALDRVFKVESIVSLAGFPILSENKLQGVLFIADRYRRKLTGREVSVLGSFALHAGVAMRNARAFTLLSEALAEAERNRVALDRPHSSRRPLRCRSRRNDFAPGQRHGMAAVRPAHGRPDQRRDHSLRRSAFRPEERFASAAYRGGLAADLRAGKDRFLSADQRNFQIAP